MGLVPCNPNIKVNKTTMRTHKVNDPNTLAKTNVYSKCRVKTKSYVNSYISAPKKTKKTKKTKKHYKRLKKDTKNKNTKKAKKDKIPKKTKKDKNTKKQKKIKALKNR